MWSCSVNASAGGPPVRAEPPSASNDDAALVEVSDHVTGEALDLFIVPAPLLEIKHHYPSSPPGGMEA